MTRASSVSTRHDLLGVGAGPMNLSLAALSHPQPLATCFLEAAPAFSWHPGMLLEGATIQVPFMADLVTMADPTSPFTFLNYLKQIGRLYPFFIRESFYPLRREYDAYGRWVAEQLPEVHFGTRVTSVERDDEGFVVTADGPHGTEEHATRHLALGIGTKPSYPAAAAGIVGAGRPVLHSADYLGRREELTGIDHVTVLGSGQSAAEIYRDLLLRAEGTGRHVAWVTRSPRFFPMEYTKLTLEMTSPDYAGYHRSLDAGTRERLAREQRHLYKGISGDLIDAIYDDLYRMRVDGSLATTLLSSSELRDATLVGTVDRAVDGRGDGGIDGEQVRLSLHHTEQDEDYELTTGAVVLATGYTPRVPSVLDPVVGDLARDERGRLMTDGAFRVDRVGEADHGRVYLVGGDEHVHSLISPDLGMAAYRSSVILRDLLGREVYPVEERIAVQDFGVPGWGPPRPADVVAREAVSA